MRSIAPDMLKLRLTHEARAPVRPVKLFRELNRDTNTEAPWHIKNADGVTEGPLDFLDGDALICPRFDNSCHDLNRPVKLNVSPFSTIQTLPILDDAQRYLWPI